MTGEGRADPTTPEATRAPGKVRREDGYGLTLLLTILSITCLAVSGGGVSQIVGVGLTGATLVFALRTSGARPRIQRAAEVMVVVAIVSSILAQQIGDPRWAGTAQGAIGLVIARPSFRR